MPLPHQRPSTTDDDHPTVRRSLRRARHGRRLRTVIIVGEARSGTSVLYRTLIQHAAFRGDGVNLVESHGPEKLVRLHAVGTPGDQTRARAFLGEDGYEAFTRDLTPLRAHNRRMQRFVGPDVGDAAWWVSGAGVALPLLYWHAVHHRGARRIVDKNPQVVGQVRRIRQALPAADLLYIHRNPVDTFASMRRRVDADPRTATAFTTDPDEFARRWSTRARTALEAARDRRVSLTLVDYTDLVERPEPLLAAVCHAVGEPWDPAMLTLPESRLTRFAPDPALARDVGATESETSDWVDGDEATRILERVGPLWQSLRTNSVGVTRPARTRG